MNNLNLNYYKKKYFDISSLNLSDSSLNLHWEKYGKLENRYNNKNTENKYNKKNRIIYYNFDEDIDYNSITKNNLNILISKKKIKDLDINNYSTIHGNMNLYLFDLIIAPDLESWNYLLNKRFIKSSNIVKRLQFKKKIYNKLLSKMNNVKVFFLVISNNNSNLEKTVNCLKKLDLNYNVVSNEKLNNYLKNLKKDNIDWIFFINSGDTINDNFLIEINKNINEVKNLKTIIFRIFNNKDIIPKLNDSMFTKEYNYLSFGIHIDIINKFNLEFTESNKKYYEFLKKIFNKDIKMMINTYLYYNFNGNENFTNHKFPEVIINNEDFKIKMNLEKKLYFYVINLEDKKEKYFRTKMEFMKFNLLENNLYRFNAIRPKLDDILNSNMIDINKFWRFKSLEDENDKKYCIGAGGCKLSHYNLLKHIYLNGQDKKYHIILEDDCLFFDDIESIKILSNVLNYIEINNIDFNILYLGCNLHHENSFEIVTKNLLKCNKNHGHCTHAMLFKKENIPKILNHIENSKDEIDNTYTKLNNRYIIFPMIAIQREDVSDISVYREFWEKGLMNNKNENDSIFYGNFNKKFIYDKINKIYKN